MKEWTLTGRIVLSALSYILSLVMFINTSAFSYRDFKTSFITLNLIVFIIIGIGYVVSKNMLKPTFFMCIILCIPSVMAYSKLGKSLFEVDVENNFNAFITAMVFLLVVSMLLLAGKLKKVEQEYLSLVSGGADEENAKFSIINSLKVYLAFLAGIFLLAFIVVIIGFVFLNIKGSISIAIVIAALGMALFSGCVYYLSKKY